MVPVAGTIDLLIQIPESLISPRLRIPAGGVLRICGMQKEHSHPRMILKLNDSLSAFSLHFQ